VAAEQRDAAIAQRESSLDAVSAKSSAARVLAMLGSGVRNAACLLGLIAAIPGAAFAQNSAPEEKAPTLAEAKAAFAKADRALNQAWSVAKAAVSGRALTDLTGSQRDWLEFRDYQAGYESEQAGEKDRKRSAVWHTTAAALTDSRAEWLRGRAETAKAAPETLTGTWIDSYGGTMRLVHQPPPASAESSGDAAPARLLFDVEVVRGPTYHTGGVAGIATWNQRIGWWSDKGVDPEKTDESNLAFVDREGCLEVIGANTSSYHGARAYFDGIYCKVGPLDKKAEAEVVKAAESGEVPEPSDE
jgi:uncharacterized protein YecT (DUF1311 family)